MLKSHMDFYLCHGTLDIMSIDNSSTVHSNPEHCRSNYGKRSTDMGKVVMHYCDYGTSANEYCKIA